MNTTDGVSGVFVCLESDEAEINNVLAAWKRTYPAMGILALVAEAEREYTVRLLQRLCNSKDIPLCGAIFPAIIADDRFHGSGCLLLRFDVMPYSAIYSLQRPGLAEPPDFLQQISHDITSRIVQPYCSTLFMVFDAMVANIATILDDLYLELADQVHYLGANAGSESFQSIPCLFDNENIVQHAVLVVLLENFPGAVVEHCYQTPGTLISATSTEGNKIISIDWRPAFEVYQDTVEAEYGMCINRDNFYQYAVHYPFGIMRTNNEIVVRIPVALEEDGSLLCVGEVPANSVLTLMKASEIDSGKTIRLLVQGLSSLNGTVSGCSVLSFYCAGRRMHLGEIAKMELAELHKASGAQRVVGALSLGEIGHSMPVGYPLFHNGAMVCCRWNCP